MANDTYFETLSGALDYVREKFGNLGFTLDEDDMWVFNGGGISYGQTKSRTVDLLKDGQPILGKTGKPLNRAVHISLYRMPSGKYELTVYKTW